MRIKKLIITGAVALSILGSSLASAQQATPINQTPIKPHCQMEKHSQCHQMAGKLLTVEQRAELHTIKQSMFEQMRPLLKEKHALRLQLMGKIATPNMQWSEVAGLLNRINENNAQITALFAKTQFTTFQKLGVTLPVHHKGHATGHHQKHLRHHKYC